jgi:FkbM family methyltransferase
MNFDWSDMTEVREFEFRGKSFKAIGSPEPWHPSLWTFLDETETRDKLWTVQPGDVVLDVGADFGSYALTALAAGAAKVVAWSPPFKLPETAFEAQVLRRNAELNSWDDKLLVHETGLYDRAGWLAAFDGPRNAIWCPTRQEALNCIAGKYGHCAVFEVAPLDDYLGLERVDWLKADVEGCEEAVLRGGERLLKRFKPAVICEWHYHLDWECEDKCGEFLQSLGYRHVSRIPHESLAHSLYRHEDKL